MRHVIGSILVTTTIAALIAGSPNPASAAPRDASCPATVAVPPVRLTHHSSSVPATLVQNCLATSASWTVKNAGGTVATLTYTPATAGTTTAMTFAGTARLGRHDVVPKAATNAANAKVGQKTTTFYVKLGSGTIVDATRTDSGVTITGKVSKYAPTPGGWVPWNGAVVILEGRASTAAPWLPIGLPLKANKNGLISKKVLLPQVRQYRLNTRDTGTVWGSVSATAQP